MKPASEFDWITKELVFWQGYNSEVHCDCGSCAVLADEGWVIFDPIPLATNAWDKIIAAAPLHAIVITNANHQRESLVLRDKFGIGIYAPAATQREIEANIWIAEGDDMMGFLPIGLPGAAPGETAYCNNVVLVLGDAIINTRRTELLPDKYCTSPDLLRSSLQKLLSVEFQFVCFAHGLPLTSQAQITIKSLARLSDERNMRA